MARPKGSFARTPKYRLHKSSGQAVVCLSGKDIYLGPFDSSDSKERYHRLLAEWQATGRTVPPLMPKEQVTVTEVLAAFWQYAQGRYKHTVRGPGHFRIAFKTVRQLYGSVPAVEFGPKSLRTVRDAYIAEKTPTGRNPTYRTVNRKVWCVQEAFRWAAETELISATAYHALTSVKWLERGQSAARDPEAVGPVPQEDLDAVLPLLLPKTRAVCELMLVSGMRPGEAVIMRSCDIDMTRDVWAYKPPKHKNQWRGQGRIIYLGPKAQAIIAPYLSTRLDEYIFRPNKPGYPITSDKPVSHPYKRKRPPRPAGRHMGRNDLNNSIRRAIRRADRIAHRQHPEVPADQPIVMKWHAHQLRHNAATSIRAEAGIEAARAILGHRNTSTTAIYAEVDTATSANVMRRLG